MSHSYVDFRGQFMQFKDIDIIIWVRCILAERIRARPSTFQSRALDAMFAFWATADAFPGPGCVDLRLDKFIADDEERKQLLSMMKSAEKRIYTFGDTVPSEYLNEVSQPPGYDLIDLSSERVLDILGKFRSFLLKGAGQQM